MIANSMCCHPYRQRVRGLALGKETSRITRGTSCAAVHVQKRSAAVNTECVPHGSRSTLQYSDEWRVTVRAATSWRDRRRFYSAPVDDLRRRSELGPPILSQERLLLGGGVNPFFTTRRWNAFDEQAAGPGRVAVFVKTVNNRK